MSELCLRAKCEEARICPTEKELLCERVFFKGLSIYLPIMSNPCWGPRHNLDYISVNICYANRFLATRAKDSHNFYNMARE